MIHPPGDIGFARNADGIALILIAESAKQVIKLVIHLGNPGKDNQILAKLLDRGFSEIDQVNQPGILVDDETGRVRVYRRIGKSFWAWIGNPHDETDQPQVFLEVLLSLALAFRELLAEGSAIEEGINERLRRLAGALLKMQLSPETLPKWVSDRGFSDDDLFYLVTAISAFYDEGI